MHKQVVHSDVNKNNTKKKLMQYLSYATAKDRE